MIVTKRILAGAALAVVLAVGGCNKAPADLPYGTVQQMMANEVQPTAEAYWDSVRYVSELVDGEEVYTEYEPQTEEDWQKVIAAADRLAELGETLKSPAYAEGRSADWVVFADGLIAAAGEAKAAAETRDPDKVFEVGGLVYNVCSACHQAFPPENMPVETAPSDAAS